MSPKNHFHHISVFLKQIFNEGQGKHVQDNLNGSCVEKQKNSHFRNQKHVVYD